MARGGVNKVLVSQAREAILARGEHPSIDAVRIELGNTGSKSTIHRYLKEIEEVAAARLDDEALLSRPIKELIARLVSGLQEEAQATVEKNKGEYKDRIHELSERCTAYNEEAREMVERLHRLERIIEENNETLKSKSAACDLLEHQLSATKQSEASLSVAIKEKQAHIDSLEEKHRHSREVLEHYRQSVREQRDQDQRRHEQQVQELQAEIRSLNQTVAIKQAELTESTTQNARLASELSTVRKEARELDSNLKETGIKLEDATDKLKAQSADLERHRDLEQRCNTKIIELTQRLELARGETQDIKLHQAKLEAELSVKTDLVERFMADKEKTNNARTKGG